MADFLILKRIPDSTTLVPVMVVTDRAAADGEAVLLETVTEEGDFLVLRWDTRIEHKLAHGPPQIVE
jgi:hypothetical protein